MAEKRLPLYLTLPLRHHSVMVEPMLSQVNLRPFFRDYPEVIESVSAGGESGPDARPCDYAWVLDLHMQCVENGVSFSYHQTDAGLIKPCGESRSLEETGADCSGCMTVRTFETAIGQNLKVPPNPNNRKECACYLTGDIGAYNTCGHLCRYCYANADKDIVLRNMKMHDPESPFLIGNALPEDEIHQAKQKSWVDPQMRIDQFFSM